MKIKIYQIIRERDKDRKYLDPLPERDESVDGGIYDMVWSGEVQAERLDDVFIRFNSPDRPEDFRGHSLSVSDVVEVLDGELSGKWYCNSQGWRQVTFRRETVCSEGDRVYVIGCGGLICECIVKRIEYDTGVLAFDERSIGHGIFLSREAAEQHAKELEGDQ